MDDFERIKEAMTGVRVKFPQKPDGPDEVGTVTDVFFQPAIDTAKDNPGGLVHVSKGELPDQYEGYPGIKIAPKILCRVLFRDCCHITEPEDLILVDEENS